MPLAFTQEDFLVLKVYRHGDRSPTKTYPTDPYQEDAWPSRLGSADTGMIINFIGKKYTRKNWRKFKIWAKNLRNTSDFQFV